jgi:DNA-binding GntR family transcriptional regulator
VQLASELGTSRGTVRDAVRLLTDDGLVEVHPHRGTFVVSLTMDRVRDLYELKLQLEPMATRQGIENGSLLSAEVRAHLAEHVAAMRQAAKDGDFAAAVHQEREIHETLWSHGHNQLALSYLNAIHLQTKQILTAARSDDVDTLVWDAEFHARLVDAVLTGDPGVAEKATVDHLIHSRDRLQLKLEAQLAEDTT